MDHIIKITDLSKNYGHFTAVNHISFQVQKGELFAFLGTNGAGKSTTIHMICSLLEKTSGKIVVNGSDMDGEAEQIRRCLGVVFQNNSLDDLLTVKENLTIRARLRGLHGREFDTRMEELKQAFALDDIWNRPFGKLSGGQKRKCEIAQAVLHKPELLILDEPTTGLDPQTRTAIWGLIRDMQTSYGMTVFLTTHYMEEAAAADHVVILERGTIRAEGTPAELKRQYGKDLLKLWFDAPDDGIRKLRELGYAPMLKADHIQLSVANSREAFHILERIKAFRDFELIKGTMDDVFLTVTGYMEEKICEKSGS